MDEEIAQLLSECEGLKDRYEEVRAAAEARVSDWRWTTGFVSEFDLPFDEELFSRRRGRLVKNSPKGGPATRVGLDDSGRPVAILHYGSGIHEETTDERFALDDDAVAAFHFFRVSWRPVDQHLDETSLVRVRHDDLGRPERRLLTLLGGGWRRERYEYEASGRCVAVVQDSGEGGLWRYEATYRADGQLARIEALAPNGTRSTAYAHLDVPLPRALEQVESDLAGHLSRVLERDRDEPLWALALAYEAEVPLPPTILGCTLGERETWSPGSARDWWLTNPAEWDDDGRQFALPPALSDLCAAVAPALDASGQQAKAVKLLHGVARALNTGSVLVFAREINGEREEADLRWSLPDDRFDELRSAGII